MCFCGAFASFFTCCSWEEPEIVDFPDTLIPDPLQMMIDKIIDGVYLTGASAVLTAEGREKLKQLEVGRTLPYLLSLKKNMSCSLFISSTPVMSLCDESKDGRAYFVLLFSLLKQ